MGGRVAVGFVLKSCKYHIIFVTCHRFYRSNANYTPEYAKDFIEELTTEFRDEIFEYKKLK